MKYRLASAVLLGLGTSGTAGPPPLVLILADDLGYGDLGCYGHPTLPTPNLDRLAREGVRWTDFYADAPVCSPTRASLLTGRYPQRHGLTNVIEASDHKTHLAGGEVLLPELLRKAGYRTGLVGKWHLGEGEGHRPNDRGFASFFGNRLGGLDFFRHDFINGRHDLWQDGKPVRRPGEYVTDLLAEAATEFIERDTKTPFFLFLSFQAVHTAMGSKERGVIQAPERWLKRYARGREPTRADRYRACASAMDEAVGRVLASLDKHGLSRETLVVFTSDNGPEPRWTGTASPHAGTKHSLWEGGIRVPLLARWPGRFPAGKAQSAPAMTHDLMTTLLAAAGAKAPEGRALDGEDLLPLLRGGRREGERTLYWSYIRDTLRVSREQAVRRGQWKWLNGELYDLAADPAEARDLAAKHPEKARELAAAWGEWVRAFPREARRWEGREPARHRADVRK